MTEIVSNPSADREEKIEHAAKMLKNSEQARAVFKLVYTGKKKFKSIDDMKKNIHNFNTNTYKAANKLASENILEKKKSAGKDIYQKIFFYATNRDIIIRLSENKRRLQSYPTKRKTILSHKKIFLNLRTMPQFRQVYIDDIDSFNKVKSILQGNEEFIKKMAEREINNGICNILKEYEKKDWGGERNDIFSTRLLVDGKRKVASFALKGRGTKGTLVLRKMGKNGDQISRLFEGTSDLHIVVYNDTVHENIFDLMQTYSIKKALETGKEISYCIIDGKELARLIMAYPEFFNVKTAEL